MKSTARDSGAAESGGASREGAAGTRRQARAAARAAILRAARESFSEKGFSATSVSGIAARAGFTKGLIHHYFRSKRDLWRQVIDAYGREGAEREQASGEARPDVESILQRMRGSFRFFERNREYLRLATWAELEAEKGLPPSLEKLMKQHTEQFANAQKAGAIRGDVDPAHLHAMTYSLMTGWFQTKRFFCPAWGRDPEAPEVDEAFLADMLVFVEGGLKAVADKKETRPKRRVR